MPPDHASLLRRTLIGYLMDIDRCMASSNPTRSLRDLCDMAACRLRGMRDALNTELQPLKLTEADHEISSD